MQKLMSGFAAVALVFALPLAANAQEAATPEAETQDVCTATIAPIPAAAHAVATANFTAPFGDVTAIETPEDSGLELAIEKKAEMADEEMADEEEAAEAEPMVEETENVSTFAVNSAEATPGTYQITLENESGESCSAELTVQGDSDVDMDAEKANDNDDSDW